MLMKQHCSGDKLCSKSKLFLVRALSVSRDSSVPGSDIRQVVSKVHCKIKTINSWVFGEDLFQQKGTVSLQK